MHSILFRSQSPIDHAQRALDELTRLGFVLDTMTIAAGGSEGSIRIAFAADDPLRAESYRARLSRMPGVLCVVSDPHPDHGDRAAAVR